MIKDRKLIVQDMGLIAYELAWQHQKTMVSMRKRDAALEDTLMLSEHFPVYTLGASAQDRFVHFDLADPSYQVFRVERGGEVTYHCPGQKVGYPKKNLYNNSKEMQ